MKQATQLKIRRTKRLARTRKKIVRSGKPRLSVFRSNTHFYAQIIDDVKGQTLLSVREAELTDTGKLTKTLKANVLGKLLAQKAQEKKIGAVAFDKGAYKYHGRVKAFADGAREGGLKF